MVNANIKVSPGSEISDGSTPVSHRREANKARRVATLLNSARLLIEEGASTDFTMQQLADRAGLSLATSYNLIGTKAAVLYELLMQGLDELAKQQAASSSPSAKRLQAMAQLAVRFFTDQPNQYRPLLRYLLGVYEPDKRPLFMARAIAFWRVAVVDCDPAGPPPVLNDGLEEIAQSLHLTFIGALDLWVHAELDAKDFLGAIRTQIRFTGL